MSRVPVEQCRYYVGSVLLRFQVDETTRWLDPESPERSRLKVGGKVSRGMSLGLLGPAEEFRRAVRAPREEWPQEP